MSWLELSVLAPGFCSLLVWGLWVQWGQLVGLAPAAGAAAGVLQVGGAEVAVEAFAIFPVRIAWSL